MPVTIDEVNAEVSSEPRTRAPEPPAQPAQAPAGELRRQKEQLERLLIRAERVKAD